MKIKSTSFLVSTLLFLIFSWFSELKLIHQLFVSEALAQSDKDKSEKTDKFEIFKGKMEEYEKMADDVHDRMSRQILTSANWVDSFFMEERSEIEENKTNLRILFPIFIAKEEGIEFKPKARFRLVLPQINEKVHLIISGDTQEDTDKTIIPETTTRYRIDDTRDRNVTASLRYFFEAPRKHNISMRAGLRFNEITPVFFLGPRYSVETDLEPWVLRFTQTLKWFTDEGFESRTRLDFERPVLKKLFFRTSAEGSWFENENGYFYDLLVILYQPLDSKRALEYQCTNNFISSPYNRLEATTFSVRYRQKIWRDWVFIEVAPQVAFQKEYDFKINPGILLNLEMNFGGTG